MKKLLFSCLLITTFVTSCTTPHYYASPLNNTSQYYHSIPLQSDSVKSATYINGIVTLGSAESGLDNVY
ncbi:MAG TPA: hypothetical protein VK705_01195, partial [Ferruginibacter sp.]|nr:hypothetical protein [Ferruginibacter sp.]